MPTADYLPLCTIAGSDPTGGAGAAADLATFAAHGGSGAVVLTAVTVQGRAGVSACHPLPPEIVLGQLEVVLAENRPRGVKTGMLWSARIVEDVAALLSRDFAGALVVDPVLVATAGGTLLEADGVDAIRRRLAPLAALLTPNLPEAAALLGAERIGPGEEEHAARALLATGARAVLLKGGHAEGEEAVDLLATREGVQPFAAARIAGTRGHGTGCALSAALAARLARGDGLEDAVRGAKDWVHRALAAGRAPTDGFGLDHRVSADP